MRGRAAWNLSILTPAASLAACVAVDTDGLTGDDERTADASIVSIEGGVGYIQADSAPPPVVDATLPGELDSGSAIDAGALDSGQMDAARVDAAPAVDAADEALNIVSAKASQLDLPDRSERERRVSLGRGARRQRGRRHHAVMTIRSNA